MKIKRFPASSVAVMLVMSALLLSGVSAHAANARIPGEFLGVVLGKADVDDAEASLRTQGWKPEVEAGEEEDDNKLYMFIYNADKTINYWGANWNSAMYVTDKENTHVITAVSLITSYMTYGKASAVFKPIAGMLRKQYKKSIVKNENNRIMVRQGNGFMTLSLKESSSDAGSWFVILIISNSPDNSAPQTSGRKPSQTTSSETSSVIFGSAIPRKVLGVALGDTKRSEAMRILRKKGYSPELKGSENKYISVKTLNHGITLWGHKVSLLSFYFNDPKKQTCNKIYFGILFSDGSEAREFIHTAKDDLTSKYPGCTIIDESNKLVLQQNGYYLRVEREYVEDSDAWVGLMVISTTPID